MYETNIKVYNYFDSINLKFFVIYFIIKKKKTTLNKY